MHGVGETPLHVAKRVDHRLTFDRNQLRAPTVLFVEQNRNLGGPFSQNPHTDFNIAERFRISRFDLQPSSINRINRSERQQNPHGGTRKSLRLPHPTDRRDDGERSRQD